MLLLVSSRVTFNKQFCQWRCFLFYWFSKREFGKFTNGIPVIGGPGRAGARTHTHTHTHTYTHTYTHTHHPSFKGVWFTSRFFSNQNSKVEQHFAATVTLEWSLFDVSFQPSKYSIWNWASLTWVLGLYLCGGKLSWSHFIVKL